MEDFVPDGDMNCRWAVPGSVDYGTPGVKVNQEADYCVGIRQLGRESN